jgi:hypothetical protein
MAPDWKPVGHAKGFRMDNVPQVVQRIWYFLIVGFGVCLLFWFTDSDIIHLNVAGNSLVILDTYEAATELLEKRSSIYSDRYYSSDSSRRIFI